MKQPRQAGESFEDRTVPPEWTLAGSGELALSTRHAKDGRQSLRWSWRQGGRLALGGLALSTRTHPAAGMEGWVYCEKPQPGRLAFRLGTRDALARNAPAFEFRFGLDFAGWRMFRIQFAADATVAAGGGGTDIEALELVPPESAPEGDVFLDAFVFSPAMTAQRSADFQVPEYSGGLGGWCQHWPYHYARQRPVLPLPAEITDGQRRAFETLSRRYRAWLLGPLQEKGTFRSPLLARAVEETRDYIRRGWTAFRAHGVRREADGVIAGPGLLLGRGDHSFYHVFYDMLLPLAFDFKVNGNREALEAALLLFDYARDQGWAEGSAQGSLWLNCLMFAPYCHAVALLRDELRESGRLEREVATAFWYQTFGKSFTDFDREYVETNADALRSIVFTSLVVLLTLDDSPVKVQYMRGWRAWVEQALAVSPRFCGLIKPDGLGFHHEGVYAGAYATEAYEFCSLIAWLLHGTEFALSSASLANLKMALRTQDAVSNKYDIPYTLMGRMPRPGPRLLSAYAYLALADPADPEMAGIFMRLWDPGCPALAPLLRVTLDGTDMQFLCIQSPGRLQLMQELADRGLPAAPPPAGFRSQPWGALAVHRRGGWMAAVKGWSQYVWDFEMHPKSWAMVEENVFARYWSYGTLQVIAHGVPPNPVDSGWNLDRGWDWCRWPGATIRRLSLEELYDPRTSWACRFFSAASFVGSVSSEGRQGLFALKLHEHYYDPTFRALKSYFFFDNLILCLGSNIESRDPDHAVETTLFQCWMPEEGMPVRIDGRSVTDFPFEFRGEPGKPLVLHDPLGHAYHLPDGGAVRLRRGIQRSRDAWNRGGTEGAYTTAWLDHGPAPKDDGYGEVRYHYAMVVRDPQGAAGPEADPPDYRVLQQNHQAHIVVFPEKGTTGYALFETDWIVPHGPVRRTDTPVLVMVKEEAGGLVVSLADPDLRLPKRRNMGYLDEEAVLTPARGSKVRLEIRGNWEPREPHPDVKAVPAGPGVTGFEWNCAHGATVEVRLRPAAGGAAAEGERRS